MEQQGKTPQNLIDKNLLTAWTPQGSEAGSLTYTFRSAQGRWHAAPSVRIVSHASRAM